jgi:ABC-2 type transport system permease protein
MLDRINQMFIKEFIQIFRDPRMRAIIFIVPIIQTLIFGYAVTTDVKNVATAVYDQDQTTASRELIAAFTHSGYFKIIDWITHDKGERNVLDRGIATVVIHIPYGFENTIKKGRSSPVQVLIDGSEANTAGIIYHYVGQIIQYYSEQVILKTSKQHFKPIQLETRAWFNPNLESRNFYVPGVVAIMITLTTLTLTSMAIVREKEAGTIEQIIVTPITKAEFILGKTAPFILIGFINVSFILMVALYWFEVPMRGSLFLLFFAATLYLMTTLGMGLFISTISQTQQQAMMSALLFYLPAVLLSGFIFPIANMPIFIQWLTYFNPLKYFLIIIRGIFLKGIGWYLLWEQLAILGAMGGSVLWMATRRFQKTMT